MAKYMIAGHVIAAENISEETARTLSAYRYDGALEAERVFRVTPEAMRQASEEWLLDYQDEIEDYLLYSRFCLWLASKGGLYLHAAAVEMDGYAYAFSAPSGTGKSTHANLWRQAFKGRAEILNDDKPFICRERGVFAVCGSPWCGKENIRKNKMAPLAAICLLEKGGRNEITRVPPKEAAAPLLCQTFLPEEQEALQTVLSTIDRLVQEVPVYRLRCTISEDAARLSYQTMRPKEKTNE